MYNENGIKLKWFKNDWKIFIHYVWFNYVYFGGKNIFISILRLYLKNRTHKLIHWKIYNVDNIVQLFTLNKIRGESDS